MKVFLIEFEVNNFQYLLPEDPDQDQMFDCVPKSNNWIPPRMYVTNPRRRRPDIWCVADGSAFAVAPSKLEAVRTQFELAGELLPLPFDGEELTLLNVTECVNCLDAGKSKWRSSDGTSKTLEDPLVPASHVFNPKRFHKSSIFKLPETCAGYIYCWEREKDPETEFKAAVESANLSGLSFRLLWDDGVE